MQPNGAPSYAIPFAIVFGFGLIALAIFFSGSTGPTQPVAKTAPTTEPATAPVSIPAVTEADYIKGNPNAPIMIVEYSDYECGFCHRFHATMNQIMNEYGANGDVAWVYRQFPILGQSSLELSEAAFCVGELGGDSAYYAFSDKIFSREPGTRANLASLSEFATEAGVDKAKFEECVASDRQLAKVSEAIEGGRNAGIQGTPYSVIMVGDQQAVINGAQPYSVIKGMVDTLLKQLEG